MKAFTSLEQSRKLAEILPIESADAWWAEWYEGKVTSDGQYIVNEEPFYHISFIKPSEINYSQDTVKDIPCWSLAALLEVIGIECKMEKTPLDQSGEFTYSMVDDYDNIRTFECGNPIDACVEMIYELKEKDLL